MPALKNARRELFAQLLVQGFTLVDAYERAGFKRHEGNASTLSKHPEVEGRLEEIRSELSPEQTGFPFGTNVIAAKAKVTADSLIHEAELVRRGAMRGHQYGAANGAIKTKGVLSGNWVERAEVGAPGEFDHMSDDELLAAIRERFARLEGEARLAISNGSTTLNGGDLD